MLNIRCAQMAVFETTKTSEFRRRLHDFVVAQFSEFVQRHGYARVDEEIDVAMTSARSFGFANESDICLYLCIQIVLGRGFPHRPENSWMREWLNPEDELSSHARIQGLCNAVVRVLKVSERKEAHGTA